VGEDDEIGKDEQQGLVAYRSATEDADFMSSNPVGFQDANAASCI
jgi:hypothetical protein